MAVFRGNYGLNNVSAASPLGIWALIECPASMAFIDGQGFILHNITSYSFLPAKENGNYSGYYVLPSTASSTCSASLGTTRCTYYSSPESFAKGVFSTQMSFSTTIYANNGTEGPRAYNSLLSTLPSAYTLVAGDEWGQLVILHFIVAPSNNFRTYAYDSMPNSFSLGNYSFTVSVQGMHAGNTTTSGTTTIVEEYLGQYVTFNVTSDGTVESVMFSWSPNASINNSLPSPSQATLFNGSVSIDWFDNATGAYVTIMTT